MFKLSVEKVCNILDACIPSNSLTQIEGISTDSRSILSNNLFVPLKGDHFDGHKYIIQSLKAGASFSLCDKQYFKDNFELDAFKEKLILVDDIKNSYFSLMSFWRDQFINLKCIGIGGTVGKTTTKELIRRICEEDGETVYTKENLNTPLGMCISVNELSEHTKYLVCEMGTDSFGEITQEANIVKPDIGVCLSVGATHAELLGGKIDGVAQAEGELVQYFSNKGIILLNRDDPYVFNMKKYITTSKLITFGKNEGNTSIQNYSMDIKGMNIDLNIIKDISVPTFGEGNIYNIMAAVTIAKELNISEDKIKIGLENYVPIKGRLNFFKIRGNITVQDDSYNASPQSMKQSIEVFSKLSEDNFKIFVLGDMRELGEYSKEAHNELIGYIKNAKPNILIYVGDYANFMKDSLIDFIPDIQIYSNIDTIDAHKIINHEQVKKIYDELILKFKDNCWVLFKGSLGTGVWKMVELVRENMI